VVAEGGLPHVLIQTEHDMHAVHFRHVEQEGGDPQPRFGIAVIGIKVIHQQHNGPPQAEKAQPSDGAFIGFISGERAQHGHPGHAAIQRVIEHGIHPGFECRRDGGHALHRLLGHGLAQLAIKAPHPLADQACAAAGIKDLDGIATEHAQCLLGVGAWEGAIFDQTTHEDGADAGAGLAQFGPAFAGSISTRHGLQSTYGDGGDANLIFKTESKRHEDDLTIRRCGEPPEQVCLAITRTRGGEQQQRLATSTPNRFLPLINRGRQLPEDVAIQTVDGAVFLHAEGSGADVVGERIDALCLRQSRRQAPRSRRFGRW
jgi:hypothetical protein